MSIYKTYSADQLEELSSKFSINHWSYSGISTFARNPKAFEKEYVYREWPKRSSTTIAGQAYHEALRLFFDNLKRRVNTSIVEMQAAAYDHIDMVRPSDWKLQKTTSSIEECRTDSVKKVNALIMNFEREKGIYLEDVDEVLAVEERCDEWLTINGVDVPLPCHSVQDLVVRLTSGKIAVMDHKSKASFTDDNVLAYTGAEQAVIYAKQVEVKTGLTVDEFWFMENKFSANKDGSPQIKKFVITLDRDTRMLYEALVYDPLKAMLEAVADPNYVYVINKSDNLSDMGEIYDFHFRTMIAEVEDFNIPDNKKELMAKRQKKIRNTSLAMVNPKAIAQFRKNTSQFIHYDLSNADMTNGEKIEHKLRLFNIPVEVRHEIEGYSSNTYLLEVSAGTKIANVIRYKLDIASELNVTSVRMDEKLVVHEGRSYLAVEVSKKRTKDLLFDPKYLQGERIPIGADNFGRTIVWDLNKHSTPHALVCGATGSGKSVMITSTIEYAKLAGINDIVIFDPKMEFCHYAGKGVRVFNEIEDIETEMRQLVEDMQERVKSGRKDKTLVVFDEFADAVAQAKSGRELDIVEEKAVGGKQVLSESGEVFSPTRTETRITGREKSLEENLRILLQKGRSSGFRILAATQRASVKIITGDAKVNFPVLICFRVPKEVDSKVVLDEPGAETLAGAGDGLMKSPEYPEAVRFQGFYKP
jgi:hypothetical protein